jgi:steroid 5-alpha reductase family enzyme
VGKEDVAMSSSSKSVSWLDQWWPLLLILFGVMFVAILTTFAPVN